ncbi:MAG: hypothetical protein QOK49_1121 [Baekduia sp.]|nr:hypothetical protein [Baekduia sp.]
MKGGCPHIGDVPERTARYGYPNLARDIACSALSGQGSRQARANPPPMSEPRAQRTLVKSPPELWAEISDVSTLARHLGEFGDIRITRLEAETTVVWEGDRACGTVELQPSGWGTKVTITAAAVEAPEPEPEPAAVAAEQERIVEAPTEVVAVEVEPEVVAAVAPEPEVKEEVVAEPIAEPVTESIALVPAEPQGRRRLLARLFRRRAVVAAPEPAAIEPEPVKPDPEPVAVVPEPERVAEPEPEPEAVAVEPEPDPPAVEPEPERFDDARVEAVLVSVLDDLGSAHHRPFSRG